MVGAVPAEIGADWGAAQKLTHQEVQPRVGRQGAVGGFVHQDSQAQLPAADHHHCEQPRQWIGPDDDEG